MVWLLHLRASEVVDDKGSHLELLGSILVQLWLFLWRIHAELACHEPLQVRGSSVVLSIKLCEFTAPWGEFRL